MKKLIEVHYIGNVEKNINRKTEIMFYAIGMKSFAKSTRFQYENGKTVTIKNNDIVSIQFFTANNKESEA